MRLSLLLQATYDDLHSPINLRKWDLRVERMYDSCGGQRCRSRNINSRDVQVAQLSGTGGDKVEQGNGTERKVRGERGVKGCG